MKRKHLLLMLLLAFCMPWAAQAQQALPFSNGIQINDTRTDGLKPQTPVVATINDLGTAYAVPNIVNGNRAYCTPYFSNTNTSYGLYINSFVTVNGKTNINNSGTGLTEGGYTDYYDLFASIEAGETLSFTVSAGAAYNQMGYALWVDWNQDEVFDSDERVTVTSSPIQSDWTESFMVPSATPEGDYRMRVMLIWATNPGDPCVSTAYGEAEDYKLTVLPEACPTPAALTVASTSFEAEVSWISEAETFTLEYAEITTAKSPYSNNGWYYYDNGTHAGSVGIGGGQFFWGIMFPAGSIEGDVLTAVKAFDISAMAGRLLIYNDGTTAPEHLISTQNIEFTGAGDWVEFKTDVTVDPSKNVWVVFFAADGAAYPMSTCSDDNGDANGRWIGFGGGWYDLGNVGVSGRANMIRANFIDSSNLSWTTVNNVTSPYTIDGLTPETRYAVRVKALCGGEDGESKWATTTFTTENGYIFITDGNWNDGSNWYFGTVPPEGSSVTIQANTIIPSGYDAKADAITLDGGSITIKDGGQLHANNDVLATVEKEITGYTGEKDNYYLLSAPFRSSTSTENVTNLLNGTFDFYAFDGTQEEEWLNHKENAITSMGDGKGYLYANAAATTLQFTGMVAKQVSDLAFVNGGNYNSTLNYDESTEFGTWNLVGNSLPHNGYAYIGTVDGYVSFVPTYYYKMNEAGDELTISNYIVKPCEGIFVKASAANQYAFVSSENYGDYSQQLRLNVTQGSKQVDLAIIDFSETQGLEKFQLNPSHTKLYIPMDGKDYAVAKASEVGEMPVSFKAEKNSTYTLGFNTENVKFGYLHLIDNMTSNDINLLETPSYTFVAKTTDYAQRFKLVFATGANNSVNETFAFISDGNIIVNGEGKLQVVDVMGRVISQEENATSVATNGMTPGVYVLRLINGDNVRTQKIVVK